MTPILADAVMEFTPASGDNADAVVTLAAVSGRRHVVRMVDYSYEAQVAGDHNLTIVWTLNGATKTFTKAIMAGGVAAIMPLYFPEGFIVGDVNTAITITLPAGGANIFGFVNVFHRK